MENHASPPDALTGAPCAVGAGQPAPAQGWPLHSVAASRQIEARAAAALPPHTLMQRAGRATARLALAVAPQARRVWILAGPGNNGGDGLEAALHLRQAGKDVTVNLLATGAPPADAATSLARARSNGVRIVDGCEAPPGFGSEDLAIDALLGIGAARAPTGALSSAIEVLNAGPAPILAVDVPSGLDADRGTRFDAGPAVVARWTLALLCLKPGLFTSEGRDHAGSVWFEALGIAPETERPAARLLTDVGSLWPRRRHALHKGSFGDVWVVGGAAGMTGAALLAARAALAAGAGRVYLVPLDPAPPRCDPNHPELMVRGIEVLRDPATPLEGATVVCGCGGGDVVRDVLPTLLGRAGRLLLDADALNALAVDAALAPQLAARSRRGRDTVLTPHPLEAGRLMGCRAAVVQADRLAAARDLARRHGTTVVLKGSGTLITDGSESPWINASGNASLASPGTGDVLAGWLGGLWSQGLETGAAARLAVHSHGRAADQWATGVRHPGPLTAQALIEALARAPRC